MLLFCILSPSIISTLSLAGLFLSLLGNRGCIGSLKVSLAQKLPSFTHLALPDAVHDLLLAWLVIGCLAGFTTLGLGGLGDSGSIYSLIYVSEAHILML